jgi:prepilin-type processing-associated H-X9-DG protein
MDDSGGYKMLLLRERLKFVPGSYVPGIYKMKRSKGFTRVDLLVTLLCAAFLVVTMGAVGNRGRERAKQTVCLSNLGKIAIASMVYADACEGRLVPVEIWDYELADKALDSGGYDMTLPSGQVITPWVAIWCYNGLFCEILGMNPAANAGYYISEHPEDYYGFPKGLRCPDALAVDESVAELGSTTVSVTTYAPNITDWARADEDYGQGSPEELAMQDKIWNEGVPVAEIRRPQEKVMFTDTVAIYVTYAWGGGNYIRHWDEHGEIEWGYDGYHLCEPMYRHSEGANVGYADGHAGYRKKQEMFYFLDGNVPNQDGTNVDVARNDKLWCYFE